jgi:poly-gamma-glutamate synthesis protein (capsule biosynthesis protein)
VVLGNLEGPFTNSTKHAVLSTTLSFTFDPPLAPTLKRVGFTTLSLANNHTLNQGQAGLNMTRTTLKKNGLDYFGDPRNGTNYHLTKTINGERVTFLGYDNLDGKITTVLTDIKNAHRKGEYVIVVPHWGAEYQLSIQPKLQQQAKQLIDAGADMVLGGHPHVVEPFEIYKSKFIAYSLGNFVFDQYFSADTQQGLMLKLAFTSSTVKINVIPLASSTSQVAVASGTVKKTLLERIAKNSVVSSSVRRGIRAGSITLPR